MLEQHWRPSRSCRFSERKKYKGLGYEYAVGPTVTVQKIHYFQAFSVLRAKRLTNEELFYCSRCNTLRYSSLQEGVLANRSQFNITDTLIKVPQGGFASSKVLMVLHFDYSSCWKFPVTSVAFIGEFIPTANFPVELVSRQIHWYQQNQRRMETFNAVIETSWKK